MFEQDRISMSLILRILLFFVVIVCVQVSFINHMFHQSRQLLICGNLPHRGLGGLFWCMEYQPQREDYAYQYLIEWLLLDKEERMLEGQTRPVVPMLITRKARDFPESLDIQKLKEIIMKEHLAKKSKFPYGQGGGDGNGN